MQFVANNHNQVHFDQYGYIVGCRLDTQLVTSRGVVDCTLRRKLSGTEIVVAADLLQEKMFMDAKITVFSSGVNLRWNGTRYRIVRRLISDHSNELWLELENLISNLIVVNE